MKKLSLLILDNYPKIMRNVPDLHDMEGERNIPEIICAYDIEKDAWNRRTAKNTFTHWKTYETMEPHEQEIINQVEWLTFEESRKILIPYLSARYERKKERKKEYIDEKVKNIKLALDKQKKLIFEHMERLTKAPICFDKFMIWGTTCKKWPYNPRTWEIWKFIWIKPEYMEASCAYAFTHELLHIQTHKYYKEKYPMNQLNFFQFSLIKEALTFLLNYEFPWVNMNADTQYPSYQEYSKVLEKYRLSCWDKKDFEDLINFGCNYILENNLLSEEKEK